MQDQSEKQDLLRERIFEPDYGVPKITTYVTDSEKAMMKQYMFSKTVDHPEHYNAHPSGVECIDVIEHMPFNIGNAVKYLWRLGHKGDPVEQLEKAIWYLEREKQLIIKRTNNRKPIRNHNTGEYE